MNIKINNKVFDSFPVLESERLIYRAYEIEDAPDLFQIRSDPKVLKFMDAHSHKSTAESEKSILSCHDNFKDKQGINWAIIEKESGKFIGYFGFWRLIPEHCRAEIGYALKPSHWGQGYMNESLKRLIKFGFEDLQVHSIEANINPNNEASKKALLKIGFKQEAYFRENYLFDGRFTDSAIFSLIENQ